MARKMSRNAMCAFCGGSTTSCSLGEYLEVEITIPDATGPQRQILGAHTRCMDAALLEGIAVEVDALLDD